MVNVLWYILLVHYQWMSFPGPKGAHGDSISWPLRGAPPGLPGLHGYPGSQGYPGDVGLPGAPGRKGKRV